MGNSIKKAIYVTIDIVKDNEYSGLKRLLYVGKASSSSGMLYGCFKKYVDNLDWGNIELIRIKKEKSIGRKY